MKPGKLYGVGLGPGDPELLTIKAARLIAAAKVIAYPAPVGEASFARSIAANLISAGAHEIIVSVPMTPQREPAQAAYDVGAAQISKALSRGDDVVVLCEGDPLFYGSFMYLFARLSAQFDCEIVPGVTSLSACASALKLPLTARNEVLSVVPAPLPDDQIAPRIIAADAVAILKVGRHMPRMRALVEALGLTAQAHYIERATLPNQKTVPLADAPETVPYFSMILIVKGADPWLI